jgi:hypothetical protein
MVRLVAVALLIAVLIGCSGTTTSNPPPTATPSPSPTVEPIDPSPPPPDPTATPTIAPTPVPATPEPTPDATWTVLNDWFVALGLELPDDLPPQPDDTGDGTTADGSAPAEISQDLDIVAWIAGWAQLPADLFTGEGALACSHEEVLCTDDPLPPSDSTAIIAAVRVNGSITLGEDRDGQISLAMTRPGFPNTTGGGGYQGGDLVVVADLTAANIFALEWKQNGGFVIAPRRGGEARVVLVGDTALFVIPNDINENPSGRFVTFERIPPDDPSAARIDVAPEIDSFFDIDYRINFGN